MMDIQLTLAELILETSLSFICGSINSEFVKTDYLKQAPRQ